MQIEPFEVEQWMNAWENECELNLAETCVASLTLAELMQIAGRTQAMPSELAALKMTYGAITGSLPLRRAVAALHAAQTPDNVLICHGTAGANHLVHQTLVSRGDHVVAITPTYQQHTAIPRALGAEVTELALRADDGWLPDLEALEEAMRADTRLLALTNPNNPTGALIEAEMLQQIVAIARRHDAWILCDEVYRGTEDGPMRPAMADLYEKGISTGSTSKTYALAGLRLGWIVGPEDFLREAEIHRDYSTISVSQVDDYFATMALESADALLERARQITGTNRALLAQWVAGEPSVDMVMPSAGTTALVAVDDPRPSADLCQALLRDVGVLLVPGSAMGMEGHVRFGYACETGVLKQGLARVSGWLAAC